MLNKLSGQKLERSGLLQAMQDGCNAMKNTMPSLLIALAVGVPTVAGVAQEVGIGTTTPTAILHVEASPSYPQPLFKVLTQGAVTPYLVVLPNGNVGVGIVNPSEVLDVAGNVQFGGALMPGGSAGTAGQVLVSQGPGVPPQWQSASAVGDNWGSQVAITNGLIIGTGVAGDPIRLISGNSVGQVIKWDGSQWVLANDSVGTGGDNWGTQVVVTQAPITGDGTSGNPLSLQTGNNVGDILVWNGSQWVVQQPTTGGGVSTCASVSANYVQKWTGSNLCNSMIYDNGLNVGIGTNTPAQKLDVAGNIQFSGALMPGGNAGAAGQVLVSQGPGTPPVWTTLSSGGGNCFSVNNWTNEYVDTFGNEVGCGALISMTWEQCIKACQQSTAQGFSDWRMPTIEETIDSYRRGTIGSTCYDYFWTATPTHSSSGSNAYYYTFSSNNSGSWTVQYALFQTQCRCVR